MQMMMPAQVRPTAPGRHRTGRTTAPGWLLLVLLVATGCPGGKGAPLDRGTVHIAIEETIDGEPTDLNISELLIGRRLLHHGFRLAEDPAAARYHLTGKVACTFYQDLRFNFMEYSEHLEYQFEAEAELTLTDQRAAAGEGVSRETFRLPRGEDKYINGRKEMDAARRDIRRDAATELSLDIVRGELFGNDAAMALIEALADPLDGRGLDEVRKAMHELGMPVVPYLLMALQDERIVRLAGDYPGLTEADREQLRVYHIADQMLGRILDRQPALAIDSDQDLLFRVQKAWTWVWEDRQKIPEPYRVEPHERATAVPAGSEAAKAQESAD